MSKTVKKIICIIIAIILIAMIPISILMIKPAYNINRNYKNQTIKSADEIAGGGDYIHFLNTGGSDAILIESNGQFAMVDAGEDSDNPRGFENLELDGYEEKVVEYLKKNAADENGKVHLDFVLGTHCHSDHIGGFDTVIYDKDIEIGRAYLKEYDSTKIRAKEVDKWDNQEVYDQMLRALEAKNVPVISKPDGTPFTLGNFTITLFNTTDPENDKKVGENDQSISMLIEKDGTKVFLSGDMDNLTGDEDRVAPEVGKVDLLKLGHHSYHYSSTSNFIKTLLPEYCVVTNEKKSVEHRILWRVENIADSTILITGKEDGIIAEIGSNGEIQFYNAIHN